MDRLAVRRYVPAERDAVWVAHDRALRASAMDYDPEYNRSLRHARREFVDRGGDFLVATVPADSALADDLPARTAVNDLPSRTANDDSEHVVGIGGFQPLQCRVESFADLGLPELDTDPDVDLDATAQIRSVAVLPAVQSRGVGSALMDELESRAADAGFAQVVLNTPESLRRAHGFYESRGFDRVDRDGGEDADGAGYRWYGKRVGD